MILNRRLNRNRIVYVIPPPYMKFLKRKSASSRCPSSKIIFDPSEKFVDPSKIEVSDSKQSFWFRRTTAESHNETKLPTAAETTPFYQTTPTAISSQVRTAASPFTQLTTQFSSKTTDTSPSPRIIPATVTSIPATSTNTTTTKKARTKKTKFTWGQKGTNTSYPTITESAIETSPKTKGTRFTWGPKGTNTSYPTITESAIETSPKSKGTRFTWGPKGTNTSYPTITESAIETSPRGTSTSFNPTTKESTTIKTQSTFPTTTPFRFSPSPTEPKYTPSTSSVDTSSTPTCQTTLTPAETKGIPTATSIPDTFNTSTQSCEIPNKCLEWYNKIKDGDRCDTEGNCSKWYNLIKEQDKQSSMKSSCTKIGSASDTNCLPSGNRLALNRTDKYSDIRPGVEYFQPIFSSSVDASEVLDNPFMEFLITRSRSNKKGTDVFNLTIDDRIRTLKWLNQQILQRYGILAKIDRMSRVNRSFANSNPKTMSRKVSVNNGQKTTRAQRLRDEFIRKKMQRMSLDKNDGWWKNFNAKSYRKNSNGYNFLNSSVQEVE